MKFKIKVNNPSHTFKNALLALSDREYATRAEACEAIYASMHDRICEYGLDEMPMDDAKGRLYICDRSGNNREAMSPAEAPYSIAEADTCDTGDISTSIRRATSDDDCDPSITHVAVDADGHIVGYYVFLAGHDDEYFMDHYLTDCHAHIMRDGCAECDGVTATVEEMSMTFDEICKGEPVEIVETLADGETLTASCWTDDADMLDEAAFFDLRASWGDLGRFDGVHGELDGAIRNLCKSIGDRFGGCWSRSNDDMIVQA